MHSRFIKEFLIVAVLAVTFAACQTNKPVPVPQLQEFRDGSNLFTVKVPDGWPQSAQPGKLWVYNSNAAADKFFDPTSSSSKPGVKIYVFAQDAGGKTTDDMVQAFKDSLRQMQAQIQPDVKTELAGYPAVKIPYALKIDNKNTVYSFRVLSVVDSTEYGFEASGFNNEYNRYMEVFDSVESTFGIVPKVVVRQQLPENLIPSTTTSAYNNKYLTIQYPDNFTATPRTVSGDLITSEMFKGYREDCTMQVDVLDAKKLSVGKILDQNKGKYPANAHIRKTTLDGLPGYEINYSPYRSIRSRAYFVVKNDKWIRITLNWYEPMQKDYLPAFEKAVASLRLK